VDGAHPTLVSVHFPKTAGTSFGLALRRSHGEGLLEDYGMLALNTPRVRREWQAIRSGLCARFHCGVPRAIHGHFLPIKYRFALRSHPTRYVTWLRHPVERLLSHYYFWLRTAAAATPAQPLRYRVVREQWSLERFCFAPQVRNLYSQFLWGFPPSRFDFIGITEHYESDLATFARRYLPGAATAERARVNTERGDAGYALDPALRARIEQHHARDMRLYRWALQRRQTGAAA
jgi:hypothetical protein